MERQVNNVLVKMWESVVSCGQTAVIPVIPGTFKEH